MVLESTTHGRNKSPPSTPPFASSSKRDGQSFGGIDIIPNTMKHRLKSNVLGSFILLGGPIRALSGILLHRRV